MVFLLQEKGLVSQPNFLSTPIHLPLISAPPRATGTGKEVEEEKFQEGTEDRDSLR